MLVTLVHGILSCDTSLTEATVDGADPFWRNKICVIWCGFCVVVKGVKEGKIAVSWR